ncbi:MAG: hypothetical protein KGN79_15215 [Acidobacteriota bacterium]|nr:hypothetical protein [Acidobacteriota bacterium]
MTVLKGNWRTGLVVLAGLLAAMGLTGCFGKLKEMQGEALKLDTAFHKQMATGDLAGIYNNSDPRYRDAVTREKSDALFSAIARKLGAPLDCKQENTNFNVSTSGTTITSVCETHFAKNATGTEKFTWLKSGDNYKLLGYNINSDDLMER